MEEKKPIEESLENLEKASGGANFGTDNADEICFAIGNIYPDFVQIDSPKWPGQKAAHGMSATMIRELYGR